MKIKDLFIYPIKSLGGISVSSAICEEKGFRHDRRMMLVDNDGKFITQRQFPELATISSEFTSDGFRFVFNNNQDRAINIKHDSEYTHHMQVQVWKHQFDAAVIKDAGQWFSAIVGMKVHLVKMTSGSNRKKSLSKAPSSTQLSMADGYPYLIISEDSLKDLNRRLIVPVPMNRFRPNIVLSETEPYEEEKLDYIYIGDQEFRIIKGCARCEMIGIDQKSAKKLVEPLKTLSNYKRSGNKVYFGMYAVSLAGGEIRVGDSVTEK